MIGLASGAATRRPQSWARRPVPSPRSAQVQDRLPGTTHSRSTQTWSFALTGTEPVWLGCLVLADVDATVAKWRSWIEGPIRSDVVGMHFKRLIWREIAAMMNANPTVGEIPSAFWDFHQENYAVAQAIAIRRQADRDPRTCSLAVLIGEMRDNAELLTREDHIGLLGDRAADDLMRQRANAGFTELASGGDHLDPTNGQRDLAIGTVRRDRQPTLTIPIDRCGRTVAEALAGGAAA